MSSISNKMYSFISDHGLGLEKKMLEAFLSLPTGRIGKISFKMFKITLGDLIIRQTPSFLFSSDFFPNWVTVASRICLLGSLSAIGLILSISSDSFLKHIDAKIVEDGIKNEYKKEGIALFLSEKVMDGYIGKRFVKAKLSEKFIVKEINIKTISELEEAIEQTGNSNKKIKVIFIHAHGSSLGIQIGDQELTGLELQEKTFSKIDEDASIILQSCSTGRIRESISQTFCIAQNIANIARRKVFAPIDACCISNIGIQFSGDDIKVTLRNSKNENLTRMFTPKKEIQ